MPDPRVAHCIFCDDIRFERGNKVSFMGLYGDELLLYSAKPARVRFAIVAWLICDIDDAPGQMIMRGTGPVPDAKLFEGIFRFPPAPETPPPGTQKLHLRAHLQLDGLEVQDDGEISVYIDTDSGSIRAGRMRIRFVDRAPPEFPINLGTNEILPSPGDYQPAPEAAKSASSMEPKRPSTQLSVAPQESVPPPEPSRPSRPRASPKRRRKSPSPS
jgi:hypothetical protein